MFESAEIDHRVGEKEYRAEVPKLRAALLEAQYELLERRDAAIVVLVAGVDGAGKGDTINQLETWLDPRHVEVHALDLPTDEERERPEYYRYFRVLPPKGKVGIFFGSWYSPRITGLAEGEMGNAEVDAAMDRIRHFERMLSKEGVVLVKLWFHVSKKQQKKRFETLMKSKLTRWRVNADDLARLRRYEAYKRAATRALRETSTEYAPWIIVPGACEPYRELTVGRTILDALRAASAGAPKTAVDAARVMLPEPIDGVRLLDTVDLSQQLGKAAYDERLEHLKGRLNLGIRKKTFQRERSLVVVFEGWDAAGKGGAIRRVTSALDARSYHVVQVSAPTDEEKAQPYLWRFWRRVPRRGRVAIFDRSWYGRVLVERVEELCETVDWMRAYSEINDFEEQLVDCGTTVVKLFLHISDAEQRRRFEDRRATGFKHYKITKEDLRNRRKRPAYERAIGDMIDRTSTELAPWTLIAAEDKRHARVEVLRAIVEAVEGRG